MHDNYFIYDGEKYIVTYCDGKINIYKYCKGIREVLSIEERKKIEKLLNSKYSHIYNSTLLKELVDSNPKIENKGYVINLLSWLEGIIPENCKENFFRNIQTLDTSLNIGVDLSQSNNKIVGNETTGLYDAKSNSLMMPENFLRELWKVSQFDDNPSLFYWRYYSQTLLHELAHVVSSRYDSELELILCGFDVFPAKNDNDKNRGLTEGFTEIISMEGVPGTIEHLSSYYIEISLTNQLIQLVGKSVFLESYFSNLGTSPIQEKLNKIINDPTMSFNIFRSIELNYNANEVCEKQNILGNIQSMLLEYLNKKIELLFADDKVEEINNILTNYESIMITPEKLKVCYKNPQQFVGIDENVIKFNNIRDKYSKYKTLYFKKDLL